MDRETRKANLKKLQLPSTNGKTLDNISSGSSLRRTRSATMAISKYFKHAANEATDKCLSQSTPTAQNDYAEAAVINIEATVVDNIEEKIGTPSTNVLAATADNSAEQPITAKRVKRTKLTAFVLKDAKNVPTDLVTNNGTPADDFEAPKKKVKTAPKLQRRKAAKTPNRRGGKRQPDIKSAFYRNEQIFAEITAQHCKADNFSADEVQLALAISRSEAETSGVLCVDSDEDMVVDLVDKAQTIECSRKTESVRNMLQRYGFRTAPREDYNSLAVAFLPVGKRRIRSKWANKFTPLTLRNPELQEKKIIAKVEHFLSAQNRIKSLTAAECQLETYTCLSSLLRRCRVEQSGCVSKIRQLDADSSIVLESYYVPDLFEVAHVQAGHLLKNWDTIQGRNLSPLKSDKDVANDLKLREAYTKLEEYYGMLRKLNCTHNEASCRGDNQVHQNKTAPTTDCELNELLELINELPEDDAESVKFTNNIANHDDNQINVVTESSHCETPIKEPPDKKVKSSVDSSTLPLHSTTLSGTENSLSTQDKVRTTETANCKDILAVVNNNLVLNSTAQNGLNSVDNNSQLPSSAASLSAANSSLTKQSARSGSPDLFADSDSDFDMVAAESRTKDELQRSDDSELASDKQGITIYEIYSSNEVKTSSVSVNCEKEPDKLEEQEVKSPIAIIDLTQDEIKPVDLMPELRGTQTPTKKHHNFTLESAAGDFSYDFDLGSTPPTTPNEVATAALASTVSDEDYKRLCEKYLSPTNKCSLQRKSISMTQLNEHSKETSAKGKDQDTQRISLTQATCSTDVVWETPTKIPKASTLERCKSASFNHSNEHSNQASQSSNAEMSIDLTQSDISSYSDDNGCVMLSDDEINYSIWKANKSVNVRPEKEPTSADSSSPLKNGASFTRHDFSILDIIGDTQIDARTRTRTISGMTTSSTDDNTPSTSYSKYPPAANDFSIYSDLLCTPNVNERSRERAEFGILENISEPFTQTPPKLKTPTAAAGVSNVCNINDFSLLDSPSENAMFMKRYSSDLANTEKFTTLLQEVQKGGDATPIDAFDDFDEFDQLIYDAPNTTKSAATPAVPRTPAGLEQLLTAELSFCNGDVCTQILTQSQTTPTKSTLDAPEEYEIAGRKYLARVVDTPKPDFTQQTEAEILKQLYAYGIKPLKRKPAVKMLEYIYNQTHPVMLDEQLSQHALAVSSSAEVQPEATSAASGKRQVAANASNATLSNKLELCNCAGDLLQRFSLELQFEMQDEMYIFQTNISKKLQQPLLPLHVAWYNLVCSSTKLHETILMFEPIDLQEIYLFLKQLGYRYNPKDMKSFFDRRCIIFRYDLTPQGKPANRHVRKSKMSKRKK